jgi:hypothetical protein
MGILAIAASVKEQPPNYVYLDLNKIGMRC